MTKLITAADFSALNRRHMTVHKCIGVGRGVLLSALVVSFWAYLRPDQGLEQFILGAICLSISIWISLRGRAEPMSEANLKVVLDMKYPRIANDPFTATSLQSQEWQTALNTELAAMSEKLRWLNTAYATTLVPLLVLFVGLSFFAPQGVSTALSNASQAVANLTWGATVRVIEGKTKEGNPDVYSLSRTSSTNIELTSENLIEIRASKLFSNDTAPLAVELRTRKDDVESVYQTFQLNLDNQAEGDEKAVFKLAISIPESVKLYIPSIASGALAEFEVNALPYPQVEISSAQDFAAPWPDDQPLKVNVKVHAENALKLVRLVIVSGKKRSEELVSNVLATDMHDLTTDYDLILTPYVESDIADVEVFAEAVDRAIPKPLLGRSNSITLKTVSAYGRYRQTLQTLRDLKELTDSAMESGKGSLDAKALQLISSAEKQAETSPYFDGLDRVAIDSFRTEITDIIAAQNLERIGSLSEQLNSFLFEHEMLDDRERDRDFFVAIRSFSRILEKDPTKRGIELPKASERLLTFLDDRHKRWTIRTNRLSPQFQPKQWPDIKARKPFHRSIERATALDAKNELSARQEALVLLSQTSADYRVWIEELEKNEDLARQEAEAKRQEGLASARNTLKELQQRQGEVSQALDKADARDKKELAEEWPTIRAKQNGNIKETKQLEGQLRALAPSAAERIRVAAESMQITLDAGANSNFAEAESASDLAGRLLRQAESAAQRSQQSAGQQRPRRYTPSDSHFGQTVLEDIEISHGYEVDARYREAVLNEAQESLNSGEVSKGSQENKILDEYLRQIVR